MLLRTCRYTLTPPLVFPRDQMMFLRYRQHPGLSIRSALLVEEVIRTKPPHCGPHKADGSAAKTPLLQNECSRSVFCSRTSGAQGVRFWCLLAQHSTPMFGRRGDYEGNPTTKLHGALTLLPYQYCAQENELCLVRTLQPSCPRRPTWMEACPTHTHTRTIAL